VQCHPITQKITDIKKLYGGNHTANNGCLAYRQIVRGAISHGSPPLASAASRGIALSFGYVACGSIQTQQASQHQGKVACSCKNFHSNIKMQLLSAKFIPSTAKFS